MSEQIEMQSLMNLAFKNSAAPDRDVNERETRARAKVAERKGGFDGFLKTFLGNDSESGPEKTERSRSSTSSSDETKTSGMTRQERRAVRESMEKTDAETEYVDEEIAAAAEEAARMIWNLLYPGSFTTGLIAVPGSDSLAGLSNLIAMSGCVGASSLTGMEAGGLAPDAVGGAIETANASAEMNMDAVLASLDELLDGMPRAALRHALAGVAGVNGRHDVFAQIAAQLDATVVEVDGPSAGTNPAGMLSELGMSAERQYGAPEAAEISAASEAESKAYEFYRLFLGENNAMDSASNSSPKRIEDLFESFARRLMSGGQDNAVKEYFGDVGGLAKAAASDFPKGADLDTLGSGPATDKVFAWLKSNLESSLQNGTGGGDSQGSGNGEAGNGQDNAALLAGQSFANAMASVQSGGETNIATHMSSMLDQMENIERLAEAMKMSNHGSVTNLTLQLAPVELGKVLLKVEAKKGVVTASIRVEKPEALAQLSESLNQLRDSLKAQGVELGEVDIALHDFGHSSGGGGGAAEGGFSRANDADAPENGTETTNGDSAEPQGSGLNLVA